MVKTDSKELSVLRVVWSLASGKTTLGEVGRRLRPPREGQTVGRWINGKSPLPEEYADQLAAVLSDVTDMDITSEMMRSDVDFDTLLAAITLAKKPKVK